MKQLRRIAYESLKTKEKSSWVIPKVVAVDYESLKTIQYNILYLTKVT